MFTEEGKQQIKAYVAAMQFIADPHRALLTNSQPCVEVVAGEAISLLQLADLAASANASDADVIYLEFEPGFEAEGPRSIHVASVQKGVTHIKTDCAPWASPSGEMFLICQQGKGMVSFHSDGMDYRPGRPKTSIAKGEVRGRAKFKARAQLILASIAESAGLDPSSRIAA